MNDIYLNNEDIQNNRAIYEEESMMLRGIIDLYFEEDDELVIVDYKTDYITDENKQDVINRYRKQLDLYADALTKLSGKKVKEKYNLSCFIKIDNSEIKVVAVSKKHDTTLANNIMRLVQEEFKQKKNITVKFEK